ncbi:MAG TPA: argininosuccinate synthase [Actinobacteria bacterium]|nr:argininosuccinate synthase [Actinomycetota bacterium]
MGKEKVVLAYSGGLDTSVAIKWLQEKYNLDVIALVVNLGQPADIEAVRDKALAIGAVESYMIDARKEFAEEFVLPALKANAVYEGRYPLATALARPLIAKHLVEQAGRSGAKTVAHGCTGKGNDQVRFEVSVAALNPFLEVIAPIREWGVSREGAIEYARKHGIPVPVTKKSPYSVDENLWGRSCECGVLEDPWVEPPADAFSWTRDVSQAPDEPDYMEIDFRAGKPVAINGKKKEFVKLILDLNRVGGKHGIGRVDMLENRLVGIKTREIYECPAAIILPLAHRELEALTLERDLVHYKAGLEQKYAEVVYYGQWYSPLKEALDAFIDKTQESVSGTIRVKLFKGNAIVVGRRSKKSLYDYSLATYEAADAFSHESAKGFIKLFGLPIKVWAKKQRKQESR